MGKFRYHLLGHTYSFYLVENNGKLTRDCDVVIGLSKSFLIFWFKWSFPWDEKDTLKFTKPLRIDIHDRLNFYFFQILEKESER